MCAKREQTAFIYIKKKPGWSCLFLDCIDLLQLGDIRSEYLSHIMHVRIESLVAVQHLSKFFGMHVLNTGK